MIKKLLILLFFIPSIVFATDYGANFLTGGTPTCDSDAGYGGGCTAIDDDNITTGWISANSSFPHWATYDLGAGITKTPGKITIYGEPGNPLYIKDFNFYASNDGTNYYFLTSGSKTNASPDYITLEITPTSTAYRYFKYEALNNHTGGGNSISELYEWYMYEVSVPATTAPQMQVIWFDE